MFKAGESVVIRKDPHQGPYLISKMCSLGTYRVQTPKGEQLFAEEDLARPAPNIPAIKEEGTPESLLEQTRRTLGIVGTDRVSHKLRDTLGEALQTLDPTITNWCGHFKEGTSWEDDCGISTKILAQRIKDHVLLPRVTSTEDAETLLAAIKARETLKDPISLGTSCSLECPYCGARPKVGCTGIDFVLLADDCQYPKGIRTTQWELNVPSGHLLVANDLRKWFPCDKDYDLNKMVGIHEQQRAYAAVGMSHGFVGNSCPSVFRLAVDNFTVASSPPEDRWEEEETQEWKSNPAYKTWKANLVAVPVASICTDLWWYSIVDRDEFKRRVAHYTPEQDVEALLSNGDIYAVKVKPGVYQFTHFNEGDRDSPKGYTYCSIEWVRDPDPVTDFIKADEDKVLPAGIVLAQSLRDWPGLYLPSNGPYYEDRKAVADLTSEELAKSLARAADQILCTNGNGLNWHPNGFPRTVISKDTVPIKIPPFTFRQGWHPMSPGYSTITRAAGITTKEGYPEPEPGEDSLHPSYVAMALNICQSIISYGVTPQLNHQVSPLAYHIKEAREQMELAALSYKALREKYPGVVFDDTFDEWMTAGREKQWITDFDLGPKTRL